MPKTHHCKGKNHILYPCCKIQHLKMVKVIFTIIVHDYFSQILVCWVQAWNSRTRWASTKRVTLTSARTPPTSHPPACLLHIRMWVFYNTTSENYITYIKFVKHCLPLNPYLLPRQLNERASVMSQALMLCFWKRQGHQGIFSLVKGTLWGNCQFLLSWL